ncbi:hypothetical protein [Streptomyces sp. NPDC002889]|uniref:hypothetical protein n=1 Tax=Streptomyces sp. NPDC002889 TaxID=3364669 RepID=UPI00367F7A55
MERVIDLDEAAAAVADRQSAWQAAGLVAEPVTWRDEAASWPQQLETDRSRVTDPDSIGVHVHGPQEAELIVVLYRGGWADIDYMASTDDAGVLPAPVVGSAQAFGSLLDACVARVFAPGTVSLDGPASANRANVA